LSLSSVFLPACRRYGQGQAFGDRALIGTEPRAASVVALEKSAFVAIDRIDYVRAVQSVYNQERAEKLAFFSQLAFFHLLPADQLAELVMQFSKKRFGKNELLCQEGERQHTFCVLQYGECRILKYVTVLLLLLLPPPTLYFYSPCPSQVPPAPAHEGPAAP